MVRWRSVLFSGLIALLCAGAVLPSLVKAAALEMVSFRLTRQETGAATDVEIGFTTVTDINAPTDTIVVELAGGFDLSTLLFSDVTLTYGPTHGIENTATIAAAAGVGTWGFSRSGNQITLSAPTDALPGTVPGGSRVLLRMGTWAGGVHQVVNPVTTGIFSASIAGTFGDAGVTYTIIRAPGNLSVTATVDNPGSSGGDGGGGGVSPVGGGEPSGGPITSDGTAPVISNLRVESITPTSVVVRWTTNEAADAYLEYGNTAAAYSLGTRERATRLTEHEVPLTALTPETEYHFHVRARDAANNTRWSDDVMFLTAALPREVVISGVTVSYVDDHQAIVRWSTNVDALSRIELGPAPMRTFAESAYATTHQLTIMDLAPATTYTFGIFATRASGESTRAEGFTFTTLSDRTPPSNVLNFRATYVVASGLVELDWVNPADADFKTVVITRFESSGAETFICSTIAGHCTDVLPTGRTAATYRAVAYDLSGNPSSGAIASVVVPSSLVTPRPATTDESSAETVPSSDESTPSTSLTSPRAPARTPTGGTPSADETSAVSGSLPPILTPGGSSVDGGSVTGGLSAGGAGEIIGGSVDGSGVSSMGGSGSSTVPLDGSGTTGGSDVSSGVSGGSGDVETLVIRPEFFLSETVPATPDTSGARTALFLRSVQVRVAITDLPISLAQAQVQTSGGSIYQLAYREGLGAYAADFSFDPAQGSSQFVQIQTVATDGRRWEGRFPFRVVPPARVLDVSDERRSAAVAGASIELVQDRSGAEVIRIDADATGRYALIAPNGSYRLRVAKEGFRSYERRLRVENGLVVEDVGLRRSLRPLSEVWNPSVPLRDNLVAIGDEAALAVDIGLETVQAPEVQAATQQVVAPAVVVATVGTTASAVTGFTLFNYLRFLFTQPFLLLRRRKRQAWGVVYNALSKQPIELAIVRLLKAGTNFALQTRITDAQGRFSFFVPAGSYVIQVQKPGFQFPTQYLKEERMDVDFTDLYHGEAIKVTEPVTISPNIPVDPAAKEETPKAIVRRHAWRKAQSLLGVGGIVVGLAAIVIDPSWKMVGFATFQVVVYAVFRRLAIPPAPKRWGIVYDGESKHPLTKAVVRIFDKKFNKLLETQITGKDGTYGFFAAKGLYYLTAEKPGYERYLSADLDLTKAADTYIDHRFSLKRAGNALK